MKGGQRNGINLCLPNPSAYASDEPLLRAQ